MQQETTSAIYDIHKSYLENSESGPQFDGSFPLRERPPKEQWLDFLGYRVASPLGVPAGPLLNSAWIAFASQAGFDIPTYKTIRSHEHPAHPLPNIVPVNTGGALMPGALPDFVTSRQEMPEKITDIAITNSFGNPSRSLEYLAEDIPKANAILQEGQVMIVSVFGTERDGISMEEDFAATARFAVQCGAKLIEANYSCPNVKACEGSLYSDPEAVGMFSKKIIHAIGDTPLIIKVGLFPSKERLKEAMIAAARAGVRAICGINTISMPVYDASGNPALGDSRLKCGICGDPIREAALSFLRDAASINREEKLELTLMGTGGVMLPEHFEEFLEAGADVAMSATGMMWDPYLAMKYHRRHEYAATHS